LEIAFPPDRETQSALIAGLVQARTGQREASELMSGAMMAFNNVIDGRGNEALPDVDAAGELEEA